MVKWPVCVLLGLTLVSRAVVLVDFQVGQPPPLPADAQQCTIPILQCVLIHRCKSDNAHRPFAAGEHSHSRSEGLLKPLLAILSVPEP